MELVWDWAGEKGEEDLQVGMEGKMENKCVV